jgi:hypothetical protein
MAYNCRDKYQGGWLIPASFLMENFYMSWNSELENQRKNSETQIL